MTLDNIRAAIAHLEDVAKRVEQEIAHDFGVVAENVHALLHYGADGAKLKDAEVAPAPAQGAAAKPA